MQINFFGKTMEELNTQIDLAKIDKDKNLLRILLDIKDKFVEETSSLATNNKFLLAMHTNSGSMQLVEDEGFSVKEIEDLVILQPLELLSHDQMDGLVDALQESKDSFPNKQIIVIPYNVRMMTATLMTRLKESDNK